MDTAAFYPVLIGADLNCYHVARAFYEAYKRPVQAFGRYETSAIKDVFYIHFKAIPQLDSDAVFLETVVSYAASLPDEAPVLLIGCTDDYANLIARSRKALPARFIIPYNPPELMDELQTKERFLELCESHHIPYPKTVVVRISDADTLSYEEESLGFHYPIIVKPANSVVYWKHPFPGMNKVYLANDPENAKAIVREIFENGYDDSILLQDRIVGNDSSMYVLTAYSGMDGRVRMMRLGHVLLEEKTPKGKGNHAAIVTEFNEALQQRFRALLESIGYVGFSNFDIKYDVRDGSYRAFEINLRQGRSNYYCTASGANIAECLCNDRIFSCDCKQVDMQGDEIFWSFIPKRVVYRYIGNAALRTHAKELVRKGCYRSSLWHCDEFLKNPMRLFYVAAQSFNQFRKYRKYCKPEQYDERKANS